MMEQEEKIYTVNDVDTIDKVRIEIAQVRADLRNKEMGINEAKTHGALLGKIMSAGKQKHERQKFTGEVKPMPFYEEEEKSEEK